MKSVQIGATHHPDRLSIHLSGDFIRSTVRRSEGGIDMSLVSPTLEISGDGPDYRSIHPDIIALCGVLAFQPVFPSDGEFTLQFDFPVSDQVQAAIRKPYIAPNATVRGRGSVPSYEPKREQVLSYGGGFDSLAAHLIYPEAPLVHETPSPHNGTVYSDVVNGLMPTFASEFYSIQDNLRNLYSAYGLPLWVSVYIASLVLEPRYILSGSEMTGTYLEGGKRYHPRYKNIWYSVFKDIGVSILPTSFLSEVGNARLVHHHGRVKSAAYCAVISRQDCNKCTKCLRRRILRGMLDSEELVLVDQFARTEAIENFIKTRPLYYGDIFAHAAARHERATWVSPFLRDLTERIGHLGFHDRYNPDTFEHFSYPPHLKVRAEMALAEAGIEPFGGDQRAAFESFRQL